MLKSMFPLSFGANNVSNLIIRIFIYLVAATIVTFLLKFFGWIPLLGAIVWLVCSLINLYIIAGITVLILNYTHVIE